MKTEILSLLFLLRSDSIFFFFVVVFSEYGSKRWFELPLHIITQFGKVSPSLLNLPA